MIPVKKKNDKKISWPLVIVLLLSFMFASCKDNGLCGSIYSTYGDWI